jgi:poly-gamma-glutamate system protein
VLAAARALELRPVIISSVGASSYGANEPGWTWPDLERVLAEHGVVQHRSARVALGGIVDGDGGLDGTGIDLAVEAIRRSGVPLLDEGGRATLEHDVRRRMELYRAGCGGKPAAFVNVGGVLASLGGSDRQVFPAGLIRGLKLPADPRRGTIARMLEAGVPVVHLLDVRRLVERNGLPFDPATVPGVGEGAVMRPRRYARPIAAAGLLALGLLGWAIERRRQNSPRSVEPGAFA